MTTIATDGKTMAGDSQTTADKQRVASRPKVHRLKNGTIVGCSGHATDARAFVRWMDHESGDRPPIGESFEALLLRPDGTVEWIDHKFEPVEYLVPMAIGSGGDIALGAMLAGKSPKRAVKIAALRDSCTDGKITVESIA